MPVAYEHAAPLHDPAFAATVEGFNRTQEEAQHNDNVEALLDAVENVHFGDADAIDGNLNHLTAYYRDQYADAAASRSHGIFGIGIRHEGPGLRGLRFHWTRRTMDDAEYRYKVALDAAGVHAASRLEVTGAIPAVGDPDRDVRIREHSYAGMLGGVDATHRSEADLLTEAIEERRLMRVGHLDQDRNVAAGGWRVRFNRLAVGYNQLSWRRKILYGLGAAALSTAVILTIPGGAGFVVGGIGIGAIASGMRAGLTTVLNHRGSTVAGAGQDRERILEDLRTNHDLDEITSTNELLAETNHTANRHNRRNSITTTVAAGATAAAFFFSPEIHSAFDHALHDVNDWRNDVFHHFFGTGHEGAAPATSTSGTASSPAASTSRAPSGSASPRPAASSSPAPSASARPSVSPSPSPSGSETPTPSASAAPTPSGSETPSGAYALPPSWGQEVAPPAGGSGNVAQHFNYLNAKALSELHRTWAAGSDPNEMTHFVAAGNGLDVKLEDLTGNYTKLPSTSNLYAAITFNTADGHQTIFVPMQNGVAHLSGELAKEVNGRAMSSLEIMRITQQDAAAAAANHAANVEVYSTVVGNGNQVSAHTFSQLLQTHGATPNAASSAAGAAVAPNTPPALSIVPHGQELITPQDQKVVTELYGAFANAYHGSNVSAAFEQAYATAVHNHVLEVATNSAGNPVYYIRNSHNVWQAVNLNQALTALQHEVGAKAQTVTGAATLNLPTGQEFITPQVEKATTELYNMFTQFYNGPNAAHVFEHLYTTAVNDRLIDIAADTNGNPVYYVPNSAGTGWNAVSLMQALHQISNHVNQALAA